MKEIIGFLICLFLLGFAVALVLFLLMMALGVVGLALKVLWIIFYPVYFLTLKPVVWFLVKAFQSRCPKCKGFWKRQFVKSEITEQYETLETVERIDQGTIYSNGFFTPNQGYEITRMEQVKMVHETESHYWECKDLGCGYQWITEGYSEYEGSLENRDS